MLPDPYRGIWGGSNCRDSIVQVTSTSVLFWCPQFRVLCVIPLRAYLRRRIANAAALLATARPTSVIWSSWTRRLTIAHRTLVLAASSPSRFRFEFEAIRVRVFVLERPCAFIMRRCKGYVLLTTGCRASTTAFSTRATS